MTLVFNVISFLLFAYVLYLKILDWRDNHRVTPASNPYRILFGLFLLILLIMNAAMILKKISWIQDYEFHTSIAFLVLSLISALVNSKIDLGRVFRKRQKR